MAYQLGVDLGITYTAAAIRRSGSRTQADAEVVALGTRAVTIPSVLYFGRAGSVLVGEAAERRALTEPDLVVREFKRRIGDRTPFVLDGRSYLAHQLGARMIRWVSDRVAEREGGPADRIAVTHPASWGRSKRELLGEALADIGLKVEFVPEPVAAAIGYSVAERVSPTSTIAVYDLGGGTFDAALVRTAGPDSGFALLGRPQSLARLGGVDFDELVFQHVRAAVGEPMAALDPTDPSTLAALAELRWDCRAAKEALSSDTEVTIPVQLPNLRTQIRLGRTDLEDMIRPSLVETIPALRRAVGSARLTAADLSAVLLVGGSSRIPIVSQLVSSELGRPVAVDSDPKTVIAIGAALAVSPTEPLHQPHAPARPARRPRSIARAAAPAPGPFAYRPTVTTRRGWTGLLLGLAAVLAGSIAFGVVLLNSTPAGGGTAPEHLAADRVMVSMINASCTKAAARDAAGARVSYEPLRMLDGNAETAWGCDGDGRGDRLTLDFGRPVAVASIGIIPGYAKTDPGDGTDRYRQGRRLTEVSYTVDGGGTIDHKLDPTPGSRRLQVQDMGGAVTQRIVVTVVGSVPGEIVNGKAAIDAVAISELAVRGVAR